MRILSLVGCTNWVIRLQTGVEWLFLARFESSKDPKRSDMSFFYWQRSSKLPQQSSKNIFFEGWINSTYKAVGSIIDCTSCTCQASTKWKHSKVVYSSWVGQSEFFQRLKWLLLRSRGGREPKFDNSLCVGSSHGDTIGWKNKYVWIRLQTGVKWLFLLGFEFSKDQKRSKKARHVFLYYQRSSKLPQQSSKIICFGYIASPRL